MRNEEFIVNTSEVSFEMRSSPPNRGVNLTYAPSDMGLFETTLSMETPLSVMPDLQSASTAWLIAISCISVCCGLQIQRDWYTSKLYTLGKTR